MKPPTPYADHFAAFCSALDVLQSKTTALALCIETGEAMEPAREAARLAMVKVLGVYNEALTGWQKGQAFAQLIAAQRPEKPDHWTPCGQCERNEEEAKEVLESAP